MLITHFKFVIPVCCAMVAALSIAPACVGQMTQCDAESNGVNYKVLVDEVQYATATAIGPALSIELIRSTVEGALEKLRRGVLSRTGPQGTVLYLNCTNRHPSSPSLFDDGLLVRNMAANHIILEFWGTLFPLGGGQHKFDIYYVLFPVASLTPPAPSGIKSTEKIMNSKPTPDEIRTYLIDARADLPAYFTVAAGTQAYADRNWDQAVRFLCEGRTRLKRNAAQPELMNFADQLASKAAAELRKSNDTSASLLTEAQAKNYCSFATTR
jgi:hypothetical protein